MCLLILKGFLNECWNFGPGVYPHKKTFSELAHSKSQLTGEPREALLSHLYENLSVSLHRDNARSVLKRFARSAHSMDEALETIASIQSAAAEAASVDA